MDENFFTEEVEALTATDPTRQLVLANLGDRYVLSSLARNPHLILEVQLVLTDSHSDIIYELVFHPNLFPETQRKLFKNQDWYLDLVGHCHYLLPEIQRQIVESDNRAAKRRLTSNPSLLPELQLLLFNSLPIEEIAHCLMYNDNLLPEIFTQISHLPAYIKLLNNYRKMVKITYNNPETQALVNKILLLV